MVILIDEPEAFLHPSLALQIGKEIASAASRANKRVFVATHSPSFLMGCVQSGASMNIVRLTYRNDKATARLLPKENIVHLMRNPLLRSTNVLAGLFYEAVVVAESDADRAFYQEINERLLRFKPEWGIPNCLFLNAQNKQTVRTIVKPLRDLGIPAAAVLDVDVIKDGGASWSGLLSSAFVPSTLHNGWGDTRSKIWSEAQATNKDIKRHGGIFILPSQIHEAAAHLFADLRQYGIFVVEGGELESWLKELNASGHSPNWLMEVFEKMDEDPDAPGYLKPGVVDVWFFLRSIREWIANPMKKGVPGLHS